MKTTEKIIESFFANDFCPECGEIMIYSSHFCKECNQSVSVPFSLGMKALNNLIKEIKATADNTDFKTATPKLKHS